MSTPRDTHTANRHQPESAVLYRNILKRERIKLNNLFLGRCLQEDITPNFTKFSKTTLDKVNWSPRTLHQKRMNILSSTIKSNEDKIKELDITINSNLHESHPTNSKFQNHRLLSKFSARAYKNHHSHRVNLDKKFKNLNSPSSLIQTIQIFNDTEIVIPQTIINILKYGADRSIGGHPCEDKLARTFEYLVKRVKSYASKIKLDKLAKDELITKIKSEFHNLRKIHPSNDDGKILSEFLTQNPDYIFMNIDKSKNLRFISLNDYKNKLNSHLDSPNFEKLDEKFIQRDYQKILKILEESKPYIDPKLFKRLSPNLNAKKAFALNKEHKPNHPIRLITSGCNSMTENLEKLYLKPILEKIKGFCKFSISDTSELKTKLLEIRDNFDEKKHTFFSLDIKSAFESVDANEIINYICDKIYISPEKYFNKWTSTSKFKTKNYFVPPRKLFVKLLKGAIQDFTGFESLTGFYKQTLGIGMGNTISPILCNIYCSMIENDVVSKLIRSNEILMFVRFVDDCLIISDKSAKLKIFTRLNSKRQNMKYTIENSKNNSLNFLDTTLFYCQRTKKLELKHFTKESKSRVMTNFRLSVAPKFQKANAIFTSVNRIKNSTTNSFYEEKAVKNLNKKLLENSYPKNFIKDKIEYAQKGQKKDYGVVDEELYLSLTYTSERCTKIHENLLRIFKKFIPKFRIIISWKTIRIQNIISKKLKPRQSVENPPATVYHFTCDCKSVYIGETLRNLETRIKEHGKVTDPTEIGSHIPRCEAYKKEFLTKHKYNQSAANKLKFLKSHFKIIRRNQFDYHTRKFTEGYFIHLLSPCLNKKNECKKVTFI